MKTIYCLIVFFCIGQHAMAEPGDYKLFQGSSPLTEMHHYDAGDESQRIIKGYINVENAGEFPINVRVKNTKPHFWEGVGTIRMDYRRSPGTPILLTCFYPIYLQYTVLNPGANPQTLTSTITTAAQIPVRDVNTYGGCPNSLEFTQLSNQWSPALYRGY